MRMNEGIDRAMLSEATGSTLVAEEIATIDTDTPLTLSPVVAETTILISD